MSHDIAELEAAGEDLQVVTDEFEYNASLFKALADGNRQRLLYLLRDGEKCVSELLPHFDILQPTVSTHLLMLEELGFLKVRREGRKRLYSVADTGIYEKMESFLKEISDLLGR
jgi:DNA-binding transcriptional ArsR family regulator